MVNNPELINKFINNINKLDDEIIKEAIQEVESEDMEEDIKILEGECDCIYFENGKCQYNNGKSKCDKGQAIENLLKRYKELEEMLKHRIKYTRELEQDLFENARNYVIPISVIQNKIMNLNLEIEKLQIEYEKEVVNAYKQVNLGKQTMLSEKVKLLQELLEERNK